MPSLLDKHEAAEEVEKVQEKLEVKDQKVEKIIKKKSQKD